MLILWYIISVIFSVYVCWLLSLNLTLGYIDFANSAYSENWTLLYEALSILATKKNACFERKWFSLLTPNKKMSTFNFVSKVKEFLPKIPPISHTFLKHKQHWTFIIRQSFGVRQKLRSFLKLDSNLKIFLVVCIFNCCSASLPSVYLKV